VRVSVVIPCFNYGHHLAEAVESVLAQSLREAELIIVDDGSTDDSREVAQALIADHPEASVRLICQSNSGFPGTTRNVGVAVARADYVLCLDADDKLHPDYLEACAAALDSSPQAAIAYGDFQMFGDADTLVQPQPWDTRTELDCNFVGTASLFRRQAWKQVGGYDSAIGYEDWDFWIGCIEHGWIGVKAPNATWYYRVHGGGVYSGHLQRDQEIKARIVLKHPRLYGDGQRRWAAGVVAGDALALQAGTQTGAMPPFIAGRQRPPASRGSALPIRSICLITKDYPPNVPGGIPRAVQMQAHTLAAAGIEVHVITRSASGVEGMREDAGVVVHEVPEPGLAVPAGLGYLEIPVWSFVSAAKFAQLDASERFDIVEAPDYRGEALHLVPRPETALIVWLHSTMMVVWNCEPGYVRTPADDAWHALEMAALQRADLLLAPSELLLETTALFLGERMRPAELMPYLFDSTQFPSSHRQRGDGRIHALFYGRLEARKNPELALHAVAAARARGLDIELTFLGRNNGNYREQVLLPLQAELGLDDVSYVPHVGVDRLRAVLSESDVAILASRFDNSPLTIFESLSSGVPVITSDRVGTASWIEPENGLLALPVDEPAEFGRLAADAMADSEWMASGARGAARMREKFAPEIVLERLLDCYGRLMAARGRSPQPTVETAATHHIDGARRQAVLAFADELVDDPLLLTSWAKTFDGRDDITLVIYAPDWSAEQAQLSLGAVVEHAGLDDDDAADLLAVALPASRQTEARLAAGSSAILSRRRIRAPFADLRRVNEDSIAALRNAILVTGSCAIPHSAVEVRAGSRSR
jgi:glycosyltransferase involved in cell wall biosynthesis